MARKFVLVPGAPETKRPGRTKQYYPVLEQLIQTGEADKWYLLAEYTAATGARDAYKRIRAGKIRIPEGSWQFKAQTVKVDGETNGSVLYVKVVAE